MTSRTTLTRKAVDDVLGGDEMWKHADATTGMLRPRRYSDFSSTRCFSTASCDKCNHDSAYFYQLQIRSADEPMTTCESLRCLVRSFDRIDGTQSKHGKSLSVRMLSVPAKLLPSLNISLVASIARISGVKTKVAVIAFRAN